MMLDIVGVKPLDGYRLELTFENAQRRVADIAQLVSFTGVFEPLRDPHYFRRVTVNPDVGTIVWPNGADLCPDVLHQISTPLN
jgi:Protein of unknown function (DUF2442)